MQFAIGMAAAWFVAQGRHRSITLGSMSGTAIIALSVALYGIAVCDQGLFSGASPWRDLLLAFAYAGLIVAVCNSTTPLRSLFNNRAIAGLGLISYSVFLIHQPTAWLISQLLSKKLHIVGLKNFLLLETVGLVAVLLISYGFFILVERPFMSRPAPKTERQAEVAAIVNPAP